MRKFLPTLTLLVPTLMFAQAPVAPVSPPNLIQAALTQAILGDWAGVLEYRDYSEPPTSNKVVEETDTVVFDPAASSYSEAANGKPPMVYKVAGYESLKDGRGVLVLAGSGTDNDKPSETRVTITIRRNLLEILEETRPAGSDASMAFRHAFRFTRSAAPAVTAP